jgi:predicted nucleic acid-binding protein
MKLIVDASIGIKWFKKENEKDVFLAMNLLRKYQAKAFEIIIPDLFFFEVINALLINTSLSITGLQDVFRQVFQLHFTVVYPDEQLVFSSIIISKATDLTFYDSVYIGAAQNLDALLVTADKKILHNKNKYGFIKNLEEVDSII